LEEEADLLAIIGSEGEQQPPNLPLSALRAQNAKIEKELQAARLGLDETEQQIDLLLGKNVKLKAELNEATAKVERARKLKDQMERQFRAKLTHTRDDSKRLRNEIAQLKREKKQMNAQFEKCKQEFDAYLVEINRCVTEQQLLLQVITFKGNENHKLGHANEKTGSEIAEMRDHLERIHDEFEAVAKQIAEANDRLTRVQKLVEINRNDPRCTMENIPEELVPLLDSLNAVNEKLD
jgi:predicted  nucleic acid-binding Zn-ribbon protein